MKAARAELAGVSARLVETNPGNFDEDGLGAYEIGIRPLHEATVGAMADTLYLLLGAVGLMLLIACANVASLLLARATARHREVAVRAALGASRRHLFQQLLLEALSLSLVGGGLGVVIASAGVGLFSRLEPGNLPLATEVAIDWRVLAVALGTTLLTGIVFGVAPALRASRMDINEAIRDGGAASGGAARQRLRSALVVVEVALAVVLTVGAGLLFNSFLRLASVDPGFDTDSTVLFRLSLNNETVEERMPFVDEVLASLRSIPGVESAGVGVTVPFQITGDNRCCWFDQLVTDQDPTTTHRVIVTPVDDGFFRTIRSTLRGGRVFATTDSGEDPVAVLGRSAARRIFGREEIVGEVLHVEGELDLRVVGVIDDVRHWGLGEDVDNLVYVPYRGFYQYFRQAMFVVRGERDDLAAEIRRAVWSVDPDRPVDRVTTMRAQVADSVATPRFYSGMFVVFSVVALLLAAGGIYGIMMFHVGQRTRELRNRASSGCRAPGLVAMVVRRGITLAGTGLVIGLLAAAFLARLLENQLFGIQAVDGLTFVAVAATLLLVATLACYVPARRAGRADPLLALRAE